MATRWRWPPDSWRGKRASKRRQSEDAGRLLDALVDLAFGCPSQPEREAHVGFHGHMRIERVVLEHHGDVALFRRHVVNHSFADADFTRCDVFQACDHPEQGGLAAP
jgi:hypothetical protein